MPADLLSRYASEIGLGELHVVWDGRRGAATAAAMKRCSVSLLSMLTKLPQHPFVAALYFAAWWWWELMTKHAINYSPLLHCTRVAVVLRRLRNHICCAMYDQRTD